MNENKHILRCTNVTKTFTEGNFNVPVLQGIYLRIAKNERIAIVGASGSGKSTLLHILGGLDIPTSGLVEAEGQDLSRLSAKQRGILRNKKIGFVYQFHHLLPEFTALENVAMPLIIRRIPNDEAINQAKDILQRVGLEDRIKHKPGELSGGERQRVAIARALVTKPMCVLADEPTGNLDRKTAENIYELMLELNQETGTSLVVVTHDMALASQMDRSLKIEDGVLHGS
ncbi:MAG TPA: lipoprotein-releasing ABC transporter ATP-binding protein LolD [Acidiferrobacteraceae bacterium]|nr:lipoprotein-releasing ABC transporter ATP-binding protein LolD [Acidiferrobacteraceae bacterium]HEX20047.1 lipoprotein-releasing ABC transporter ATP-binding protein LolD [Acidiferrobacteraceae bacterium]